MNCSNYPGSDMPCDLRHGAYTIACALSACAVPAFSWHRTVFRDCRSDEEELC